MNGGIIDDMGGVTEIGGSFGRGRRILNQRGKPFRAGRLNLAELDSKTGSFDF